MNNGLLVAINRNPRLQRVAHCRHRPFPHRLYYSTITKHIKETVDTDGYFVIPYTIGNFFASTALEPVSTDQQEFKDAVSLVTERVKTLMNINGKRSADSFHKELGHIMWDKCGMARNREGLEAAIQKIPEIKQEFWENLRIPGSGDRLNPELEKAGRVADFLEFGELMCRDALQREESCGGHFREEHQTAEGEATRNDEDFAHAAVWEFKGETAVPERHKEELSFENVKLVTRSYK